MMSNRARRMAQHHMRHKAGIELNLIPLIDILSVMVSFLLVYSTSVEVIQNTKGIQIPMSETRATPNHTVLVTITKTEIFVQGDLVGNVAQLQSAPEAVTTPLHAALVRAYGEFGAPAGGSGPPPEVTILADKTLPYSVLKLVMNTCGTEFGRISLALTQKEKPVAAGRVPGA